MKQRTWTELQEDCSRKSSNSCYLLTSCATDLPDMSRRWREHQTFSTMWGYSTSVNYTSAQWISSERQKEKTAPNKHKWWLCFLSSDLPTPPFLTLQLQELCFTCWAYFSSRNIWGWEATSHSEQLLFPSFHQPSCSRIQVASVTTEWGEKLWEFALAQAKAGRTGRGLT